jgi:hypothetical protein
MAIYEAEIPPNDGGKTRLFTNICGVFAADALWRGTAVKECSA